MLQGAQILHQRYQLDTKFGQNPQRQTWLAQDVSESSPHPVIVKLLAFNPQMNWDELKLFEREAQVLQHLNHPRIPQYRDYFAVDQQMGEGLPWFGLVQDYICGDSLQTLLDQGKKFTEKQVRQIAINVLEILIYLHELSPPVFHRDIKPSNLILGNNGQVYLVDFGAVQDRATAEGVTFTVVGTSGYAPPEQLWGRAVPASDLYALGATLIHLLTSTPPTELPQHQMRIQFSDRISLTPQFSQWLEIITEPAPERRFSSARQALVALQARQDAKVDGEKSPQSSHRPVHYGRLVGLALLQFVVASIGFAIVAPSFLNSKTQKDHQSEARLSVSSMNRAHQAYYLENLTFANTIPELGTGIPLQTANYNYSTRRNAKAVFHYGIARKDHLKSYVGGIFVPNSLKYSPLNNTSELLSILCEASSPGRVQPPEPIYKNGQLSCPPGTREVSW